MDEGDLILDYDIVLFQANQIYVSFTMIIGTIIQKKEKDGFNWTSKRPRQEDLEFKDEFSSNR